MHLAYGAVVHALVPPQHPHPPPHKGRARQLAPRLPKDKFRSIHVRVRVDRFYVSLRCDLDLKKRFTSKIILISKY
jgi:hypothetical protein